MDTPTYDGTEPAVPLRPIDPPAGVVYVVRPPRVPPYALPIFDEASGGVVGFRMESGGVTTVYDLDGTLVSITEIGLESPLFDPIDLLFIGGALFRALGKGLARAAPRLVAGGLRGAAAAVGEGTALLLRNTFRRFAASELRFTGTTVARMMDSSRHVPVHILELAIKHGARVPDPRGAANAFAYTIRMTRNGVEYTLKVVLRESDRTVLHFHYFR